MFAIVVFSVLAAIASAAQEENSPQFSLAPEGDLQLTPVRAIVPEKFSHLGDEVQFALPPGFEARIFAADGLEGPRFMAWSADGVLHVANMKVDSPSQWSPAADRSSGQIVALPDRDQDGVADTLLVVADGFWWVHSLAFYQGDLYVADTDKVYRMRDGDGDGFYEEREIFVDDLPSFESSRGGGHVTKTIVFDPANERFFLNVGSPCDLCRDDDPEGATVLVFNADGTGRRVYARGLRNAIGLDLHPLTGQLWATHNGHDRGGDDLPPEWVGPLREGGFYGWPLGYANKVFVDFDVYNEMLPLSAADSLAVQNMDVPAVLIPAHLAPMGIHFYTGDLLPSRYRNAAFVAVRGGRFGGLLAQVPGFKVIAVFSEPDGSKARVADFLTGFGPSLVRNDLWGRPVGVTSDRQGHLYVTSDHTHSVVVRIGLSSVFAQWQHAPPDTLVAGSAIDLGITVELLRFDPQGEPPELVADLSALGGPAAVPLRRVEGNAYVLETSVQIEASNGVKEVPVRIAQNTDKGMGQMTLPARIVVLPGEDLVVLDDALLEGWRALGSLGAGTPQFSDTGPVFEGALAGAVATNPLTTAQGWLLSLIAADEIEPVGYKALRFAFHPGDAQGSQLEAVLTTLTPLRTEHRISLLDGAVPSVDLNRREWQVVEIPLDAFPADGPIGRVGLSGDLKGTFHWDGVRLVRSLYTPSTAVLEEQTSVLPESFELAQNYPNPFNSETIIRFALPVAAPVELAVFNMAGQEVVVLVDGARGAGQYAVHWDGRDGDGRRLGSGVYFYRLRAGERTVARKLLLLR